MIFLTRFTETITSVDDIRQCSDLTSKTGEDMKCENFQEVISTKYCFVMGMMMLIPAIFGFFENLSGVTLMQFGAIFSIIYLAWAIGQFFEKKLKSYIKSLLAYIIGMLTSIVYFYYSEGYWTTCLLKIFKKIQP